MKGLGLKALADNVAATIARQLGAGLLQLVSLALIARVYGAEGNGAYTVALLLPTMLASLLNLGIGPANVYYLGSQQVAPQVAWRSTLKLYGGISIAGLSIGAVMLNFFARQWFPGVPELLLWFALSIFPVVLLNSFVSSIFQGLQQFRQFNVVLLLQPLLTLLGIVVLVVAGVKSIGWLLAAYLGGSVATVAVGLKVLWPLLSDGDGEKIQPAAYGKAAIGYGYKAHLSNILAFINYKADIFLVNLFMGPAGAGVYVIAVQISERLWLLSQAVSTVLLPRLSQLSSEENKRKALTPLIARWVLFVTFLGSLALAVIAHPVIKLVFGVQFTGAVIPLLLLLPGIVVGAASRVLANDIAARGRPELNMYTTIIVVIVNIAGNVLLVPRYGLLGAAIATSIAYTANFAMRLAMHHYFTGVSVMSNLLLGRADLEYLRRVYAKKERPL